MSKIIILLLLCISATVVRAQMVIQAEKTSLQPQIGRDDSGFSSCGVRTMVIVISGDTIDSYDFSLIIRADAAAGLLKAGKERGSMQRALKGDFKTEVVVPAPIRFWVAKESEGKAVMPQKIIPAENRGYILAIADLVETVRGIISIIEGERMQFSVRYASQPVDVVVSFAGKMPDIERIPLMACLQGLGDRFSKSVDEKSKN